MHRKVGYVYINIFIIACLCLVLSGCGFMEKAENIQKLKEEVEFWKNKAMSYMEYWKQVKSEAEMYQGYFQQAKSETKKYKTELEYANTVIERKFEELKLSETEIKLLNKQIRDIKNQLLVAYKEKDKLIGELNKQKRAYADLYK